MLALRFLFLRSGAAGLAGASRASEPLVGTRSSEAARVTVVRRIPRYEPAE